MSYEIQIRRGDHWRFYGGAWATKKPAVDVMRAERRLHPRMEFRVVMDVAGRRRAQAKKLDALKVAVVEAAMQRWTLADVDGGMGAYTDACIAEDAACAALAAAEKASRPAKAEREDGR